MIIVGVCDEEQSIRSLLARYVECYRIETEEEIQLLSYSTGDNLIKNNMLDLDLIFLEIPLRRINSLKVAEHIMQSDKQVRLVFLTTVLSYVLEAYEVGASNYILKPLSYDKFCNEMSKVLEKKTNRDNNFFVEQNRHGLHKIYFREVRYIETHGKGTLIHIEDEVVLSTRQMKQFEQLFDGTSFVRCHTGYIVNLQYFRKVKTSMITLTDGTEIPISRNRRSQVIEKIRDLYGGYA